MSGKQPANTRLPIMDWQSSERAAPKRKRNATQSRIVDLTEAESSNSASSQMHTNGNNAWWKAEYSDDFEKVLEASKKKSRADEHRNIVEEQLGEYEESLLQDQQKELEAQIMKESIQMQEEHTKKEKLRLENEHRQKLQQEEDRRGRLLAQLPDEPSNKTEGAVILQFLVPNTKTDEKNISRPVKLARNFLRTDSIDLVFKYLKSVDPAILGTKTWCLMSRYPQEDLSKYLDGHPKLKSLNDLDLFPRSVLVVRNMED